MDDGLVISPVGTIIDLTDSEADYLLKVGAVEPVAEDAPEKPAEPVRRRRAKE
jgi:hypothetical protein